MRSGEPRNPPPGQSADHREERSGFGEHSTRAGREVTATALPVLGYLRRRRECGGRGLAAQAREQVAGRMLRRGVSHAGR